MYRFHAGAVTAAMTDIIQVFLPGIFRKYATTMGALVSAPGSIVILVPPEFGWPELPFSIAPPGPVSSRCS